MADIARKLDNVRRQAEDADPRDPFTQGLRQRYNDLDTERQAALGAINQLDQQQEPTQPSLDQLDLIDALPYLAINLDQAPGPLLERLFDLTQLTVRIHYATNEATLKVTLPADEVHAIAEIGQAVAERSLGHCGDCPESAGDGQCATCACPRCDSNAHWTDFESAASAGWATGALAVTLRDGGGGVLGWSRVVGRGWGLPGGKLGALGWVGC